MTHKIRFTLLLAIAAMILCTSGAARADVISDWNEITVQRTIAAPRPGPTGVIDLAIVHAAMYDAVQAIERKYEPYYVEVPGASGNPVAAAAKAARDVLVNRFSSQSGTIDMLYAQYLAANNIPADDPGVAVGAAVASRIIALRACDGSFPAVPPPPFVGGTGIGVWRPTPPANQSMQAPWLGNVVPFFMTRPSQFRAEPPPAIGSRQYERDYEEVKSLGALDSDSRKPDQTDIAHFYAGNTLVIWNRGLRDIANANVTNVSDSSRLFALAELSVADALITSWNDKVHYVFWRPITAIREGDNDGNPDTAGDPVWQSLITTPNYPDYTSGAVNFATAMTKSIEHVLGTDTITFSITTTNTGPTVQDTRTYSRLSDAVADVVDARVFAGIHFRFADEASFKQSKQVAMWGFRNYLRPVTGNHPDSTASLRVIRK